MVNFMNTPKVKKPMGGVSAIHGPGVRGTSGMSNMHPKRLPLTKPSSRGIAAKAAPLMGVPNGAASSYLPSKIPNPDQNPTQAFSKGGSVQAPSKNKVVSCKNF